MFFAGNIPSSRFCPAMGSHFNVLGCTVAFITLVTGADPEKDFQGQYSRTGLLGDISAFSCETMLLL